MGSRDPLVSLGTGISDLRGFHADAGDLNSGPPAYMA